MSLAAGTRLGPYEVLGLIGAGGTGEVYKARDTRLDPAGSTVCRRSPNCVANLSTGRPDVSTTFVLGRSRTVRFLLAVALMTAFATAAAAAQEAARPSSRPMRQISSVDGKDLYAEYCAPCHGREGKGDGPRAKDLSKAVPDLTRIAARNGGQFKRSKIERFISGEDRPGSSPRIDPKTGRTVIMTADGPDPMPVWQLMFRRMWSDQPPQLRIANIARYLEKIQVKD